MMPLPTMTLPKIRSLAALLAAAALTAAGAACGAAEAPEDAPTVDTADVAVVDNAFEPVNARIEAGETVTWTWEGDNRHDVSFDDFSSEIQRDGTFTHTFEDPGAYSYVCTIHPNMRGTVVVVGS